MIDVLAVVSDRLNDATLADLLCEGPEGEVAMYAEDMVPAPFEYRVKPMIIVGAPSHQGDEDTFDEKYRRENVSIRLYNKPDGDYLPLAQAAERVRTLFQNWGPAAITDGELVNSTVSGPNPGPTTDPTLAGRVLTINLLIKEN